ncbi:MAG: 2-succinyl-6-hydroxy-2,4-cyclohexadiene-1-carboxylate synthase [Ilumatobacteraceae bacterium]
MTILPRLDIGAGEPTLTFVHGFTQTKISWLPIATTMAVHHRCVLLDAPHHGEAQSLDIGFADAADLVSQTATNSVLIGYSMGGRLALAAPLHGSSQLRALVLVSSTAGIESDEERRGRRQTDERLADHIESIGTSAFLDEWTAQPMFSGTNIAPEDLAGRLSNSPRALSQSLRKCGTGVQPSYWGELSEITIPTLIVVGERDSKFREIGKRLNDQIRGSEFIVVTNAGHAVHLDQPEAFIAALEDFVARRVSS